MKTGFDPAKKIYILILLLGLALFGSLTSEYTEAQTSTATNSPTLGTANEAKEIQSLKDKIATKVAELREKNVKAVSGTVQEIKSNDKAISMKIKNWKGDVYDVKADPVLTKFFQIGSGVKKEVKAATVKKDAYVIVTGVIKEKNIDANFVYLDELFIVGSGKVTEVNKEDFFVSVVTLDKENYTLDIETFTKQQLLNIKTLIPENVGFSKIKEGDTIHFIVKKTGTEKEVNRFSAQKILTIPQEYFIK